jgi:glycosyltransferase involved in cell wall biosynthesis
LGDKNPAVRERCALLLGQLDSPTDGVEDYCRFLSEALRAEQFDVETIRLRWEEIGYAASMREVGETLSSSPINWYLLQYTALAWSKRGFPTRVPGIVRALKRKGHCAVIFHDYGPYPGIRWIDTFRRMVQISVMRKLLELCDLAILTVPREQVSWTPSSATNIVFIPVGANLPSPEKAWLNDRVESDRKPVIAIFSVSSQPHGSREVKLIADAVTYASKQIGPLRIMVFGRNSEAGGQELKTALGGSAIEVTVLGLIPAEEIVRVLGSSDVLLFTRGPISSNRGSAIAGIACGLPVIAQEGSQTAPLITEAGVVLVPVDDPSEFGPALARVLSDHDYRASLAERSRKAQERYFSWRAIAAQYAQVLRHTPDLQPHP